MAFDRGFWISWYDLPKEQTDQYIEWLHGSYIPKVLKRPGLLWAAHYKTLLTDPRGHMHRTKDPTVPTGSDYILIFGAQDTAAFTKGRDHFLEGGTSKLDADLTAEDKAMLALRQGQRQCVMTDEMRVYGPKGKPPGNFMAPGGCVQLGSFNCLPEHEEQLLSWYADYRLPAVSGEPDFIGARKFLCTTGWVKHVIMYEFPSREGRQRVQAEVDRKYPDGGDWTHSFIAAALVHAPRSPVLAERIWPPVEG